MKLSRRNAEILRQRQLEVSAEVMPLEPGRPWLAQVEERALYDDQAFELLTKEIYPLLGYSSRNQTTEGGH
jgi:ligand-binding SRPBCC domain-containing protein